MSDVQLAVLQLSHSMHARLDWLREGKVRDKGGGKGYVRPNAYLVTPRTPLPCMWHHRPGTLLDMCAPARYGGCTAVNLWRPHTRVEDKRSSSGYQSMVIVPRTTLTPCPHSRFVSHSRSPCLTFALRAPLSLRAWKACNHSLSRPSLPHHPHHLDPPAAASYRRRRYSLEHRVLLVPLSTPAPCTVMLLLRTC